MTVCAALTAQRTRVRMPTPLDSDAGFPRFGGVCDHRLPLAPERPDVCIE